MYFGRICYIYQVPISKITKVAHKKSILQSGIYQIIMTNKSYNLAIVLLLSTTLDLCYGHGYMSSPRSRQLVAFEVNTVHQIFHVGTIF